MKPKRDITLGEWRDECKEQHKRGMAMCDGCPYAFICDSLRPEHEMPYEIDLTDPPRFTEAQMALLKWWYDNGSENMTVGGDNFANRVLTFTDKNGKRTGFVHTLVFKETMDYGETLDLAELFGKEGTK